jgi:hypothetical protein
MRASVDTDYLRVYCKRDLRAEVQKVNGEASDAEDCDFPRNESRLIHITQSIHTNIINAKVSVCLLPLYA